MSPVSASVTGLTFFSEKEPGAWIFLNWGHKRRQEILQRETRLPLALEFLMQIFYNDLILHTN